MSQPIPISAWASVISSSSGRPAKKADRPMVRRTVTASSHQSRGLRVTTASLSIATHPRNPQLSTVSTTKIARSVVIVPEDGRDVGGCCGG